MNNGILVNYIPVAISTFIVLALMIGVGLWLVYDNPPHKRKLSWHHLLKDSFHLSLIDEYRKTWTVNVYYNETVSDVVYIARTDRSLILRLPINMKYGEFIKFINSLDEIDNTLHLLLSGLVNEKAFTDLHFTRQDISTYKEFKRHLLLKALKN
jgi:hypothetical protein